MKTRTALKWTIGVIAVVILMAVGAVVSLFVAFFVSMERGEKHQRQIRTDQRSGRWDFGDQSALFAVAQGIAKNDPDAIRAAAKAVPDLQAPGRDGATLLYFAVTQSWQRPELTEAVRTLLSLGADPNYTNGKRDSFAMANAVHASAPVLRATKIRQDRDLSCSLIMVPTSIRRCPRIIWILPGIRCCFTARKWDSMTASLMQMH
jgi:hypothetical protein